MRNIQPSLRDSGNIQFYPALKRRAIVGLPLRGNREEPLSELQ